MRWLLIEYIRAFFKICLLRYTLDDGLPCRYYIILGPVSSFLISRPNVGCCPVLRISMVVVKIGVKKCISNSFVLKEVVMFLTYVRLMEAISFESYGICVGRCSVGFEVRPVLPKSLSDCAVVGNFVVTLIGGETYFSIMSCAIKSLLCIWNGEEPKLWRMTFIFPV